MLRRSLALALGLGLAACSSTPKALYTDPDFDTKNIEADGIFVAGVTAAEVAEEESPRDAITLGEGLRRRLQEQWQREIPGPGKALLTGGADEFRSVLADFEHSGQLNADAFTRLKSRRKLGRYVILGRIDIDEIERTHEETRDDQEDRVRFEIELITRHHVGLSVDIYDLDQQRVVWSSSFDRRLQVRGRRFTHEARPEDVRNAPIEELREIRERIREEGYPNAPARSEVLRRLFDDVAAALPGGN